MLKIFMKMVLINIAVLLCFCGPVFAQSIMFMDESGNFYFVDNIDQVPDRYRGQVIDRSIHKDVPENPKEYREYLRKLQIEEKKQEALYKKAEKDKKRREKEEEKQVKRKKMQEERARRKMEQELLKKQREEQKKEEKDRYLFKPAPTPGPRKEQVK